MNQLRELFDECSARFKETPEHIALKYYRSRDRLFSFDERLAIDKSLERCFNPLFEAIRSEYPSISDSDLLFYALTALRYDNIAIAECLSISADTVRVRRYRMREKLSSKWLEIILHKQYNDVIYPATEKGSTQESTNKTTTMNQKMTFVKSIKTCLSKYLITDGRASRAEFWYFFLFAALADLLLSSIYFSCESFLLPLLPASYFTAYRIIIESFKCIITISLIIPSFTVAVRRLHDQGYSGTVAVFLCLIPDLVSVIAFTSSTYISNYLMGMGPDGKTYLNYLMIFIAVLLVIGLIIMIIKIIIFTKPGTEGPNDYGADPLVLEESITL